MYKQIRHPAPVEINADGVLKKNKYIYVYLEVSQHCSSLGALQGVVSGLRDKSYKSQGSLVVPSLQNCVSKFLRSHKG